MVLTWHSQSDRLLQIPQDSSVEASACRQKSPNRLETLKKQRDLSDNRVLVELIEQGIEAQKQKEKNFYQLAERFRAASDPEQVKHLGNELGRLVFGEKTK
jgi:hypothetical protein